MKVNIFCVGKIKEKFFVDAISEYTKRLSSFCDLKIFEIKEEVAKVENDANVLLVKNEEGKRILEKIDGMKNEKQDSFTISCDILGKQLDTLEFSNVIEDKKIKGKSIFNFIIGGSYGLSDNVKHKSDMFISFSKLTFPHQLFRIILLEQIYRICKIQNGEPYHK